MNDTRRNIAEYIGNLVIQNIEAAGVIKDLQTKITALEKENGKQIQDREILQES